MTNKGKSSYKIVCTPLNLVLLVRNLSLEEERELYSSISLKINKAKKPIGIDGYNEFILKKFLVEPEKFYSFLEDHEDNNPQDFVDAVYSCIVDLYPPFNIEFICGDLNSSLFLGEMSDVFKEKLLEGFLERTQPSSKKGQKSINSLSDIIRLENYLGKNIIGQDEAISNLIKALKVQVAGLSNFSSFFFIGPTGVGKSEISRLLGKKFSGNFYKINCGEYQSGHEYAKLIGSPPGFVGHTDKSLLAEKAEQSNKWVFLFDEIEKAHPKFQDFLLSLLDDGTVTDNMGKTLDFSQSIFIFTSNQGMQDSKIGKARVGFNKDVVSFESSKEVIEESIKGAFSPEFLNRIDSKVFFNSLTKGDAKKIAALELKGIPIKKNKVLLDYIVRGGYSAEYGARNIKRFIKNNVSIVVAEALLQKKAPLKSGKLYTPVIKEGNLFLKDLLEPEKTNEQVQ